MPGQAIGISMLLGYPGTFARNGDCIIMTRAVKALSENINPGDPVALDVGTDTWVKFGVGKVAADFAGIAVREVKQTDSYAATGEVYHPGEPCDVLERGSVMAVCGVGSAAPGSAVFIRTVANGGNTILGGFEAAADGTNSVAITNAKWKKAADSNKVAELVILTRQQV